MRAFIVVIFCFILAGPAWSEDRWYRASAQAFMDLNPEARLYFQLLLTASGNLEAVPNVSYNSRIHNAIKSFQRGWGEQQTGLLTKAQVERLVSVGAAVLDGWDLQAVRHPDRNRIIWIPIGIGIDAVRTEYGALMSERGQNRFRLSYEHFPSANLTSSYNAILQEMRASGDTIAFNILRNDFFAISGHQGRFHRYVRFHRDGSGLLGFDMNWSTESAPIYGKRLATAISGSLWSSMTGAPMPSMTVARYPWETQSEAPRSSASAPPKQQGRSGSAATESPRATGGTGFFVTELGHIATNDHVIAGCSTPQVKIGTSANRNGRIVARDQINDLALIEIDHRPTSFASIRLGARLGETVAVFGFPLMTFLASSGNFTLGNITATAGLGDDQTQIQISAPVQPGNSGGPLLDQSGNVVGVVVSKLDVLRAASISGDFPQNVNFAIKANILAEFLAANNIRYQTGFRDDALDSADLAEKARDMSVVITCNS